MIIDSVYLIYFSPTHTSKQVGESIVRATGIINITTLDITRKGIAETVLSPSSLAIIVVPVYGGHVAPLAMERLQTLSGTNSPVVLVVVYGNRAYEKALVELDAFASSHDFKTIAGATFIGEHSYSNSKYPIAEGRPDTKDLEFAEDFGKKIAVKIKSAADIDMLYPVDVSKIARPRQPFFPLVRFLRKVIALRKSGVPLPRTPKVEDESLCNHCGACVLQCPTQAINKGDELHTDPEKCIKCCACVKGCKQHARVYDTPFAALLAQCFTRQKEPRIII